MKRFAGKTATESNKKRLSVGVANTDEGFGKQTGLHGVTG